MGARDERSTVPVGSKPELICARGRPYWSQAMIPAMWTMARNDVAVFS